MDKFDLPADFIQNLTSAFGRAATEDWIADLPRLLALAASRWDLEPGAPVDALSYNYVCFTTRSSTAPGLDTLRYSTNGSAQDCVLKIGIPNRELTSEIECLRLWGGMVAKRPRGAFRPTVRLLESDPENGLLLLERLRPGEDLTSLADDDRAAEIAADVMSRLWIPASDDSSLRGRSPRSNLLEPGDCFAANARNDGMKSGGNQISDSANFILLNDWFAELQKLRPLFNGGTGPFPTRLLETVEGLLRDLFAEDAPLYLIHGDLHHYNILSHGDEWRVIDPKGVIGAREYEIAPFMLNPINQPRPNLKRETARRLDIFSERLGLDHQRLWAWTVAHSVLSAWWDLQEDGTGGDFALACGEAFLSLQTPKG